MQRGLQCSLCLSRASRARSCAVGGAPRGGSCCVVSLSRVSLRNRPLPPLLQSFHSATRELSFFSSGTWNGASSGLQLERNVVNATVDRDWPICESSPTWQSRLDPPPTRRGLPPTPALAFPSSPVGPCGTGALLPLRALLSGQLAAVTGAALWAASSRSCSPHPLTMVAFVPAAVPVTGGGSLPCH